MFGLKSSISERYIFRKFPNFPSDSTFIQPYINLELEVVSGGGSAEGQGTVEVFFYFGDDF